MYDRERASQYKIEHHLQLEETLYLDRYTESPDPDLLKRRKQAWEMKTRLRQLKSRRAELSTTELDVDVPTAIAATSQLVAKLQEENSDRADAPGQDPALDTVEDSEEAAAVTTGEAQTEGPGKIPQHANAMSTLLPTLLKAASSIEDELRSLDFEIATLNEQLGTLFSDLCKIPYRLHSVFIHRGTAAGGHYWVYIRDFERNVWRCYNDSAVTLVEDPERTIFAEDRPDRPGLHPATPNLLVYVRDDCVQKLLNAVQRHLQRAEDQEQATMPREEDANREIEMIDLAGVSGGVG